MSSWTEDELAKLGRADEIQVSSRRPDGSLRPFVTIWAVRSGDAIYVRSAYGHENGWFRRALASGSGRVRGGGVERDVSFEEPESGVDPSVTAAYHSKYDRYGARMVGTAVDAEAVRSTLRVMPGEAPQEG